MASEAEESSTIDLEAPDGPNLNLEGEEPAPIDTGQPDPVVPVPGWTPEQASDLVGGVLYAGLMLYYVTQRGKLPSLPEFQALAVKGREELPNTGRAMVPLLDRFLPVTGVGGIAAAGVSMIAIPAELAVVVIKRQDITYRMPNGDLVTRPLLRKAAPPPVRPSQGQAPPPSAPFSAPSAPQQAPEPDEEAPAFRFDRQSAAVIDGRGDAVAPTI